MQPSLLALIHVPVAGLSRGREESLPALSSDPGELKVCLPVRFEIAVSAGPGLSRCVSEFKFCPTRRAIRRKKATR